MNDLAILRNCQPVDLADLPRVGMEPFRKSILDSVAGGARIAALFGRPGSNERIILVAVLVQDGAGCLSALSTEVGESYPALMGQCPQAHWFEREIAEQWAVRPEGHPWLKPIRFHASYRPGHDAWGRQAGQPIAPGVLGEAAGASVPDFFHMQGEEVHEVAVGPVHAGVIEPGHFRFQCHGENVYHLEISLGYQHRGVERALVGGPDKRTIHFLETCAGDTTVGHAWAYCQAMEALAGCQQTPPRAMALRGVALELERMANHIGDLGALAGDVGYLPTASYCGRIRGDVLNATAWMCGNRFGRGLLCPGGTAVDVDDDGAGDLLRRLEAIGKDAESAVRLLWETPSVTGRFENTGILSPETCRAIGLVGVAARASGVDQDIRRDLPMGIYRFAHVPVATWHSGDVFGRAYVRWLEFQRSLAFVREQLSALSAGPVRAPVTAAKPGRMVVSLVEGWRGEICHVATTGDDGRLCHYKIVDPSFHNWFGLACALRDQQISDFPLCNKSFNLSYCGHDL